MYVYSLDYLYKAHIMPNGENVIILQVRDPEYGPHWITRTDAQNALDEFVKFRDKYGAEILNISGDPETIRKFVILWFDSMRQMLGNKMTNFFVENVDEVMNKIFLKG